MSTEQLPSVMVLKFEPQLTHSVWCDYISRCRTLGGLKHELREMTKAGDIVGYKLITVHEKVLGVIPPMSNREYACLQKKRGTR